MKKNWVRIQKRRHKYWHGFFPFVNCRKVSFAYLGHKVKIDFTAEISGGEYIYLGDRVKVLSQAWLNAVTSQKKNGERNLKIEIGSGSLINRRVIISAAHHIKIGKNVLTSPNVLIIDNDHVYEKINIPVIQQGFSSKGGIEIGDGCWIAYNAVILGNVKIGKQSVLGAGSVVAENIPPFSIVVGNPARVVKKYDFNQKEWIRV